MELPPHLHKISDGPTSRRHPIPVENQSRSRCHQGVKRRLVTDRLIGMVAALGCLESMSARSAYLVLRLGEGELLALLHPGSTDSRATTALPDELPGYRPLQIDRSGHGRSADTNEPWSFSRMADAVAGVLDQLEITGAHVVGWSDGTIVGLHLALS